jgi:hypothetical protein
MKQYEAVIQTLEKLGGQATLGELYQAVMKVKDCEWKTKTPFASIRRIVQLRQEIFKVRPGLYALKDFKTKLGLVTYQHDFQETKEKFDQSHSYYQGLLCQIGNLRRFSTFIPNQDKNKKFVNRTLGETRTLQEIPQFSFSNLVDRAKTIDVIWFNERKMPDSFYEIEHSTDIQNSLMKFFELRDFFVKMIIVANEYRKKEYDIKLHHGALTALQNRINFLWYETLVRQYEYEIFTKGELFTI